MPGNKTTTTCTDLPSRTRGTLADTNSTMMTLALHAKLVGHSVSKSGIAPSCYPARLRVPGGHHGSGPPPRPCTPGIDQLERGLLCRGAAGSDRQVRRARDLQQRSRQPVYERRVHLGVPGAWHQDQHGQQGAPARQCVRRAAVEERRLVSLSSIAGRSPACVDRILFSIALSDIVQP